MRRSMAVCGGALVGQLLVSCAPSGPAPEESRLDLAEPPSATVVVAQDPVVEAGGERYHDYLEHSPDYRAVRKDRALALGSWDRWLLIPWRYRWPELTAELARDMKAAGIDGGEVQGPDVAAAATLAGAGIRFYVGHAAGKGDLHLRHLDTRRSARRGARRPVSLVAPATRRRLKRRVARSIAAHASFEQRLAYALDDEISWGVYTSPVEWDNAPETMQDFRRWLLERYGSTRAVRAQWGGAARRFMLRMATPDDFQRLYRKPFHQWNLSPWVDALSYMDSQVNNLVGELVDYANELDPARPTGFVGGLAPAPYGGFDYAKVMAKVQFLEAYDIGSAMEIVRSFNRENIPVVLTRFVEPGDSEGRWFCWYYLAHGHRGVIVWAEGWFRDAEDRKRRLSYGPQLRALREVSLRVVGGRWLHDGVALYYSHPSIQVGWFIDAERHGRSWFNRSSSMNNRLASAFAAFRAWTKLLEDHRIQYDFVSYRDAVVSGIDPREYPVLILPAVLCLSDAEAVALARYVHDGGTLIADHQVGLFDHHGRGRSPGALDGLLGIDRRPAAGPGKLFGGEWLAEFDPETYFRETFLDAAQEVRRTCKRSRGFVVAERELETFIENRFGKGRAVLLNVSIAEYLNRRREDFAGALRSARPLLPYLAAAGVEPWVSLAVDGREPRATEVTYWERGGRVYCFVVRNPLVFAQETGPGGPSGIVDEVLPLTVTFDAPRSDVVDERRGTTFGRTHQVTVPWSTSEAVVLSFEVDGR